METKNKKGITTLNDLKDKYYGKVGTPKRNAFEKKVKVAIEKIIAKEKLKRKLKRSKSKT